MMTIGSLGATVAASASTIDRSICRGERRSWSASKHAAAREVLAAACATGVVQVAVAAELLDRNQDLHRRDA